MALGRRFPPSQSRMAQAPAGCDGEGRVGSTVQETGRGQASGGRNQDQPVPFTTVEAGPAGTSRNEWPHLSLTCGLATDHPLQLEPRMSRPSSLL